MDVRILLIPKRENPPTITANKACSTGKPVAVTLITEFQVFRTRPSKKRRLESQWKPSEERFNSSRITRTGTRKTEEFNPFSEKSKELITSMGNTENFELCETSSERQHPDCALYWESGHCLLYLQQVPAAYRKESTVEQGKIRRPVNSRLRYQKRTLPSVRTTYHKAHDMLRAARKHKRGGYKSMSLSDIGWTEEQIIPYDAIALEDHSYVATWQERRRNGKSRKFL